jgi:2'-5' RNA ligase
MEKIRNIPHVEGNFATFIYISIKRSKKIVSIEEEIIKLLGEFKVDKVDELHLSLTKTFFLKYHQISNFVKDMNTKLLKIQQHVLVTSKVKYFANEFDNRFFLTLEVRKTKLLIRLVNEITEIIKKYDSAYEFENYHPHISVLWADKNIILPEGDLNIGINKTFPQNITLKIFKIDNIYLKIGNKITKF